MNTAAAADELLVAYDAAARLPLLTSRQPGLTLPMAYQVADEIRRRRIARGERPRGYKIGFTNRSIWEKYGVHAPIWAPVWDTTVRLLTDARAAFSLAGLVQPRLEPEIVFGFETSPLPGMTDDELAGCISWVAHGVEVVQTHFDDWRFAAPDTVADFGLHGRLLVGPRVPIRQFRAPSVDLAALQLQLSCNGAVVDQGQGSVVLDGPLAALRIWVDAMHAQPQRWPIVAGDVVTTGTLTDAWPLKPGEIWRTVLSDSRLPALELMIEE